MSNIIPFKGLLYNAEKVGDLAKVMAPPYDVITPEKQAELYARHPNNVVRLILSKEEAGDTAQDNKYARAAFDLQSWVAEGVFTPGDRPAIYYYTQTYALKAGKMQTRKGFIALARLEEFGKGGIHPHERTLEGPKADRLRLMQACNANLSCIFSLYSEPELDINRLLDNAVKGLRPAVDATDDDAVKNTLWSIDDPSVIGKVVAGMRQRPLFIADGHHRYETALNYRNLMREKHPDFTGDEPFNFVMMYFSNMDDEGMTIWPTHRIVHGIYRFDPGYFMDKCSQYFKVKDFRFTSATEAGVRADFLQGLESAGASDIAIGVCIGGERVYRVLTLRSKDMMNRVFGPSIPDVFKDLDVTVLHSLILTKILGITAKAQAEQKNLAYVKSHEEAIGAAKSEKTQAVFLLNPTRIEQVKAVALAGHVMPQKSTYFYPKLLSGMVLNLLSDKTTAVESVRA